MTIVTFFQTVEQTVETTVKFVNHHTPQGSASAIFALQNSLNASPPRTRIVAFGVRKSEDHLQEPFSPFAGVTANTLPVHAVGLFNFEPLQLPANRHIFLARYGDSLYFSTRAHRVSERPTAAIRLACRVGGAPGKTPPAPTKKPTACSQASQASRHFYCPFGARSFCRPSRIATSWAICGLLETCCAHLPSRACGCRAECLRVQRW